MLNGWQYVTLNYYLNKKGGVKLWIVLYVKNVAIK